METAVVWTCIGCRAANTNAISSCPSCGAPRAGAEPSPGLKWSFPLWWTAGVIVSNLLTTSGYINITPLMRRPEAEGHRILLDGLVGLLNGGFLAFSQFIVFRLNVPSRHWVAWIPATIVPVLLGSVLDGLLHRRESASGQVLVLEDIAVSALAGSLIGISQTMVLKRTFGEIRGIVWTLANAAVWPLIHVMLYVILIQGSNRFTSGWAGHFGYSALEGFVHGAVTGLAMMWLPRRQQEAALARPA